MAVSADNHDIKIQRSATGAPSCRGIPLHRRPYIKIIQWNLRGNPMIPRSCIIFLALCIVLLFLAAPSSATPVTVVIRGPVVEMNESAHTIALRADCERYSCRYNVTGLFVGRVPNEKVFSRVKPGEVVEAVFKDWIFRITDKSTGYIVPSKETHDIRQWYAIQSLAYGDDGTLVSTESVRRSRVRGYASRCGLPGGLPALWVGTVRLRLRDISPGYPCKYFREEEPGIQQVGRSCHRKGLPFFRYPRQLNDNNPVYRGVRCRPHGGESLSLC